MLVGYDIVVSKKEIVGCVDELWGKRGSGVKFG